MEEKKPPPSRQIGQKTPKEEELKGVIEWLRRMRPTDGKKGLPKNRSG
jgi:hypothetical protein